MSRRGFAGSSLMLAKSPVSEVSSCSSLRSIPQQGPLAGHTANCSPTKHCSLAQGFHGFLPQQLCLPAWPGSPAVLSAGSRELGHTTDIREQQYCSKYYWFINNIACNNVVLSTILLPILIINQQYCWQDSLKNKNRKRKEILCLCETYQTS